MSKNNEADIIAAIQDGLEEHARMYQGFDKDCTIYDRDWGDEHLDITYKGRNYRINIQDMGESDV